MVSNTREIALEKAIQKHLTGYTTEELAGQPAPVGDGPYRIGQPGDFNAQFALDTRMFWQFLETTQAKELAKLQSRNPSDWQAKILERFDRMIKKHGLLHLLKKGLPVDDAFFSLMYPAPLASSAAVHWPDNTAVEPSGWSCCVMRGLGCGRESSMEVSVWLGWMVEARSYQARRRQVVGRKRLSVHRANPHESQRFGRP